VSARQVKMHARKSVSNDGWVCQRLFECRDRLLNLACRQHGDYLSIDKLSHGPGDLYGFPTEIQCLTCGTRAICKWPCKIIERHEVIPIAIEDSAVQLSRMIELALHVFEIGQASLKRHITRVLFERGGEEALDFFTLFLPDLTGVQNGQCGRA